MISLKNPRSVVDCNESEQDIQKETSSSKYQVFKGLVLAMLSGVCFSSAAVIVKSVSDLPPEQLAVYRFAAIFAFSLPGTVKSGQNLLGPREYRVLLILRGLFGATNILLSFFAFRYLPLGDASVIIFSVPVFVTVAARIFLKEQCGIVQCIAVIFTVLGLILTTKLPLQFSSTTTIYTKESTLGFIAAIGSLFFNTCRYIVMRKVKNVHHAIVVFTSGWVAVLETLIFILIMGSFQWHNCGLEKLYTILLGLVSFLGQTLLTMALQCEQAGPVSIVRAATDITLGFFWQTFLFSDIPDAFSISGAFLVGFSVIFLGLKKCVSILSPESPHFKRLKWMTL